MTCSITGCDDPVECRGWCSKHYARWRKFGDPDQDVREYGLRLAVCKAGDDPAGCSTLKDAKGNSVVQMAARGYCSKHYTRYRKHGDAMKVVQRNAPVDAMERFESKYLVDVSVDDTGCWLWTGASNGHGWPTITVDGRACMAHRYSYEVFRGPIPEGHSIRRECHNVSCVNPDHLALVSKDPVDRFWLCVEKTDDGHWMWTPKAFWHRVNGKALNPRQYAWGLEYGETSEVLHPTCGEKRCVSPDHAGKSQDRFWEKVDKSADGCWYWLGATLSSGYPHLTWDKVSVYAHRLSFEWAGGHLEEGCVLNHICRHLTCVRPEHLEQITLGEMVKIREDNRVPTVCTQCGEVYRNLKGHARVHEANQ